MATKILTEEQLNSLRANPNVESATNSRIVYADAFKTRFIEQYKLGYGPTEIFEDAGFDTTALGAKRIERAADRWRKEYSSQSGEALDRSIVSQQRRNHRAALKLTVAQQARMISQLQLENAELRATLAGR